VDGACCTPVAAQGCSAERVGLGVDEDWGMGVWWFLDICFDVVCVVFGWRLL
jgi:hypothetical protein